MENGVGHGVQALAAHPRGGARDVREVILLAEAAVAQDVDVLESKADSEGRVRRAAERMVNGERVGLIASAGVFVAARDVMLEMASQRLGGVFHAVEPDGAAVAMALADLGWGLLFASGPAESLDLTLVARRAAEDSGTPFLVVHDSGRHDDADPLTRLDPALVEAFVGPASARVRRLADPGHPIHVPGGKRAFAERVPFALASALRELESLTGRKRDVLTRSAPGVGADAPLLLVGLGAMGDLLLSDVPRLRAAGHDIGAVKLSAFRPFPGPRVVRWLARSHAVSVIEHTDEPLAQSNPVTREVKAAFADALTWAPEYPGVGRIPRIHSGVARSASHEVAAHDLDAVVENMLAGEHGKRFFFLGGEVDDDCMGVGGKDARAEPLP